jgi:membrane protease YdiL (CAAX protease family)
MKRYPLAAYFLLAYSITWILSFVAIQKGLPSAVTGLSAVLLHYGPALAAILVAGVIAGRAGIGKLLSGLRQWRVGWKWYAFILLYPVAVRLVAVGVDMLLGGSAPIFFSAGGIPSATSPLLLILPIFIAILFQAGLAEEIGWRGFALPRLQTKYNALVSSLILGVLWAPWHYHPANWPLLAPILPWHFLGVVCFTVLLTWVYNNTNGSLLLAVLFHTASNTSDWIVPVGLAGSPDGISRAAVIYLVLSVLVVIALVRVFGAERLSRHPQPVSSFPLQQEA